ncbi:MAG: sigma-70 family RNA polymerase sigma factor [Lentisphaeraceae bacterium]|nr:sigma-70 family RNA polymerase sigma factor [Lentisphaeraceae bacterium]
MKTQTKILKEAFGYQNALMAYAYVVLQDWNLAEDVVQDLFVTLSVKWQSYDQTRQLYPWLKRIVRNQAVNIIRQRSKEFYCADEELLDLVELAFNENETKDKLEKRTFIQIALKECVKALNEQSSYLLNMFYKQNKPCAELARQSGKSENAIYINLTRIRQQLRQCINRRIAKDEVL